MKTDAVTKALLGIIALALIFIAGQGELNHVTPVQAASAGTTYEYKSLTRVMAHDFNSGYSGGIAEWREDGNAPPAGFSNDEGGLGRRIQALGAEGWELVADVTFSNKMNVNTNNTLALNGVSTSERFFFKRKK